MPTLLTVLPSAVLLTLWLRWRPRSRFVYCLRGALLPLAALTPIPADRIGAVWGLGADLSLVPVGAIVGQWLAASAVLAPVGFMVAHLLTTRRRCGQG